MQNTNEPFTPDEDRLLFKFYMIARHSTDRTETQIKNKYMSYIKKKTIQNEIKIMRFFLHLTGTFMNTFAITECYC